MKNKLWVKILYILTLITQVGIVIGTFVVEYLTNNEYAKACIALQKYENLLSTTEAFKLGTIFRDLRSSYEETETVKK